METSLQLSPSIESFSYSWVANLKPFDASDHDDASFIEMDPRLPPSKRFLGVSTDFGFDFPVLESPLTLVHADELISNGYLVPVFPKDMKMDRFGSEHYFMSPSSISHQEKVHSSSRVHCVSFRRCQKFSKHFFEKYLKFLLILPLFRKRNNKFARKRNWEFSPATSPRTSLAYSSPDDNYWRRSCDSESSIYEAVLHCKRTQGKY